MISRQISVNYQAAKVASIFMVVFGHFYDGLELLWVPVTVGLLIFSYSSGFFTSEKYKIGFSKKNFWIQKFKRIGTTLLFADFFLLLIFIFSKKANILTWQTIVSALGLTGILNWFHIPNTTPYGAGLWFLTLLYIFYISYPFLLRIMYNRKRAILFCFVYTLAIWILNYAKPYGHMVWLTSCGFVWGVFVNRWNFRPPLFLSYTLFILSFLLMIIFNVVFNIKLFNVILILSSSLSFLFILERLNIPDIVIRLTSFFSGTIFLIYILHPYLFLKIFSSNLINTVVSVVFVGFICKTLEMIFKKVVNA